MTPKTNRLKDGSKNCSDYKNEGDLKWGTREAAKRDTPEMIEEKAVPPHIMALKEEAKNTEEAIQTEEKGRKQIENIEVLKQLLK